MLPRTQHCGQSASRSVATACLLRDRDELFLSSLVGVPLEAFHSPYVRHGIVALEANPRQKFPLYRSDEVLRVSGQVVRGNEWWRLSTVSGPVVVPINEENTRFRGDRSQTFALELPDS